MGDLKPIGSEKLPLDDKIKRIMEIARYGEKPKQESTDKTKTTHYIKETKDGIYAVVKEKDGYYVKQGLNENSLEYIGGMMKKNKNRFSSYAEAVKRCELLVIPLTEQDKRFVLKSNKPSVDEDPKSAPVASDSDTAAPPSDIPASDPSAQAPPADDSVPPPSADGSSEPAPDASMGDEGGSDEIGGEDEIGGDDMTDGGMDDDHTGGFHMKKIQKLTGKLGQILRQNKEDMEDDDIKYVINSILSAVDISKLSDESKDEITSKFEDDGDYNDDDIDDVKDDDFETGSDEVGDENSDIDSSGSGDEMPVPAHGEEDDEKELGEVDDIFENFSRLEKILKGK